MLSLAARRLRTPPPPWLRNFRTESVPSPAARRRRKTIGSALAAKMVNKRGGEEEKTEWWAVDGEMHEVGENVPFRERFVIPRDNLPNKRRKQLRDQYMRRTRLVIKDTEHEPWCKKYMELYQELRENWERLYWDEGYSKKLAQDHANYDSAEDDDQDFSPYRRRQPYAEQMKDQGVGKNFQDDGWAKVDQIRDKFEYDREKRMTEKAFAPMNRGLSFVTDNASSRPQQFDSPRYSPHFDRDR